MTIPPPQNELRLCLGPVVAAPMQHSFDQESSLQPHGSSCAPAWFSSLSTLPRLPPLRLILAVVPLLPRLLPSQKGGLPVPEGVGVVVIVIFSTHLSAWQACRGRGGQWGPNVAFLSHATAVSRGKNSALRRLQTGGGREWREDSLHSPGGLGWRIQRRKCLWGRSGPASKLAGLLGPHPQPWLAGLLVGWAL